MTLDPVSGWTCSDPIHINVPADTSGWYFSLLGGPAFVGDMEMPSGTLIDQNPIDIVGLAPDQIVAEYLSGYSAMMTAAPEYYAPISLTAPAFRIASTFPASPASPVETGCHSFRLIGTPDLAGTSYGYVFGSRRGASGERLDIHVVHSATVPEGTVLDAMGLVDLTLGDAGIQLGELTLETLSPGFETVDLTQADEYALFASSGGNTSSDAEIVLYLPSQIISTTGLITGLSSGVPGDMGTIGGPFGGVLVTTGGGSRVGLDMAQTIVHEIGHQVGLRHTSESSGTVHDLLTDTPECTNVSGNPPELTVVGCSGQGADNLMFPLASTAALGWSAQQIDVLEAVLPGEELLCGQHTDCTGYEICTDLGVCEFAYSRPYTVYIDGATIDATGPSGAWDPFGGAPDAYAQWSISGLSGTTATETDSLSPLWYDEANGVWVFAGLSSFTCTVWDYDPTSPDDLVDVFSIPSPIPVSSLRSSFLSLPGAYSTLDIGFIPE